MFEASLQYRGTINQSAIEKLDEVDAILKSNDYRRHNNMFKKGACSVGIYEQEGHVILRACSDSVRDIVYLMSSVGSYTHEDKVKLSTLGACDGRKLVSLEDMVYEKGRILLEGEVESRGFYRIACGLADSDKTNICQYIKPGADIDAISLLLQIYDSGKGRTRLCGTDILGNEDEVFGTLDSLGIEPWKNLKYMSTCNGPRDKEDP